MAYVLDVSWGVHEDGPGHEVSTSDYDLARLGQRADQNHTYFQFLETALADASLEHRGLAYTAAGGPAEDAECFYSLTGSGATWVLHEYAAPAPPQDRIGPWEAGDAAELRMRALTLPAGYASMTCHDVTVTAGTIFVLAEVADSSYLLTVDVATFANVAAFEVEDAAPAKGTLGIDGAGALVRTYITTTAQLKNEEYAIAAGVPTHTFSNAFNTVADDVVLWEGTPGAGGWRAGGEYWRCLRFGTGYQFERWHSGDGVSTFTLGGAWWWGVGGVDIRALAYDWPRGYWHEGYEPGSYYAAFTAVARLGVPGS